MPQVLRETLTRQVGRPRTYLPCEKKTTWYRHITPSGNRTRINEGGRSTSANAPAGLIMRMNQPQSMSYCSSEDRLSFISEPVYCTSTTGRLPDSSVTSDRRTVQVRSLSVLQPSGTCDILHAQSVRFVGAGGRVTNTYS